MNHVLASTRKRDPPMDRMRIHIAAIVAIVVVTTWARATVLVPDGLQPGDMYHLVFVTEGTRDATSIDIADYNAFVQAEAERSEATTENFGIDWFAIGSTAMVDARPWSYVCIEPEDHCAWARPHYSHS